MAKKNHNDDKSKTGQIRVTISVSPEDAERLRKAFEEGKLAELGITGVELESATDVGRATKGWAKSEMDKRETPADPRHHRPS